MDPVIVLLQPVTTDLPAALCHFTLRVDDTNYGWSISTVAMSSVQRNLPGTATVCIQVFGDSAS